MVENLFQDEEMYGYISMNLNFNFVESFLDITCFLNKKNPFPIIFYNFSKRLCFMRAVNVYSSSLEAIHDLHKSYKYKKT